MSSEAGRILLMLEHLYPDQRVHVIDMPGGAVKVISNGLAAVYRSQEEKRTLIKLLADRCEREKQPRYVWAA